MEMRLLLALLLTVPMLFSRPYLLGPQSSRPADKKAASQSKPAPASNPAGANFRQGPRAGTSAERANSPRRYGARATAVLRHRHGPVPRGFQQSRGHGSNWQLKKYRGNDGKLLDLSQFRRLRRLPFALDIPSDKALEQRVNWSYLRAERRPGWPGRHVSVFRWPRSREENVPLRKEFATSRAFRAKLPSMASVLPTASCGAAGSAILP